MSFGLEVSDELGRKFLSLTDKMSLVSSVEVRSGSRNSTIDFTGLGSKIILLGVTYDLPIREVKVSGMKVTVDIGSTYAIPWSISIGILL